MKIEDLQETANLAHLNLRDDELAAAFPSFEQMLGFFAAMQAADKDIDAFSVSITGLSRQARIVESGFFRKDESDSAPRVTGDVLISNAGERDGRFILVPNVL
jgi:aspartyl-tRNA(Asn)/glutamyl-tRNA(Gln) amidotransferase subunit C